MRSNNITLTVGRANQPEANMLINSNYRLITRRNMLLQIYDVIPAVKFYIIYYSLAWL